MRALEQDFDEADRRRILLEHQLLFTEAETCARWGLRVGTLRRWKRELRPWRIAAGPREWLIVALFQAGDSGVEAGESIAWIDYHDHAVYSVAEIAAWLDGLVEEGIARRRGGRWVYERSRWGERRAFVF
ncbi:hypothetical protein ACNOYE_16505 [Nannocystaceae bacterium ST9]